MLINLKPKEIIFTSSGGKSNYFIIKGISDDLKNYDEKVNHLITNYFGHESVFNSFRYLNGEIYMSIHTFRCNKGARFNLAPFIHISNLIKRGWDTGI